MNFWDSQYLQISGNIALMLPPWPVVLKLPVTLNCFNRELSPTKFNVVGKELLDTRAMSKFMLMLRKNFSVQIQIKKF